MHPRMRKVKCEQGSWRGSDSDQQWRKSRNEANFWMGIIFGTITTAGLALSIFNAIKNLDIQRLVEVLEDLDENIEDITEQCCASGSVKRAIREEAASRSLLDYAHELSSCQVVHNYEEGDDAFFVYSTSVDSQMVLLCGTEGEPAALKIVVRPGSRFKRISA